MIFQNRTFAQQIFVSIKPLFSDPEPHFTSIEALGSKISWTCFQCIIPDMLNGGTLNSTLEDLSFHYAYHQMAVIQFRLVKEKGGYFELTVLHSFFYLKFIWPSQVKLRFREIQGSEIRNLGLFQWGDRSK